jgi:hypothetical protein
METEPEVRRSPVAALLHGGAPIGVLGGFIASRGAELHSKRLRRAASVYPELPIYSAAYDSDCGGLRVYLFVALVESFPCKNVPRTECSLRVQGTLRLS